MARLGKWLLIGVVALAGVLAIAITATVGWRPLIGPKARPLSNRTFERTPQRLERGRYIASALSGCLYCHSHHDWAAPGTPIVPGTEGAGEVQPEANLPGRIVAPNLTPDRETGAGNWTDDQLARARHFERDPLDCLGQLLEGHHAHHDSAAAHQNAGHARQRGQVHDRIDLSRDLERLIHVVRIGQIALDQPPRVGDGITGKIRLVANQAVTARQAHLRLVGLRLDEVRREIDHRNSKGEVEWTERWVETEGKLFSADSFLEPPIPTSMAAGETWESASPCLPHRSDRRRLISASR